MVLPETAKTTCRNHDFWNSYVISLTADHSCVTSSFERSCVRSPFAIFGSDHSDLHGGKHGR
jgi:hypothetical protein